MKARIALAALPALFWFSPGAPEHRGVAQELPPAPAGAAGALEVLTRGPIHEAFAGQFSADPTPGRLVPKPPPPDVEEIPPAVKPEGDRVQWIPGYWAWDEERRGLRVGQRRVASDAARP